MALNTKTIKRRIKSISSTKKITKAMEMISAVKMRKAVANVLATRSYSTLAWEMLKEIAEKTHEKHHPLLEKRPVHKIGIILITSNRGLAGGFSSRLLAAVDEFVKTVKTTSPPVLSPSSDGLRSVEERKNYDPLLHKGEGRVRFGDIDIDADIILSGKRGKKIYHKFGHTVVAEFDKIDLTTRIEEVLPMARHAVGEYLSGKYDRIVIAYTDFVSAVNQAPKIKQILPLLEHDTRDTYNDTSGETDLTPRPSPRGEGSQVNGGAREPLSFDDFSLLEERDGERGLYATHDDVDSTNTSTDDSHFLFEPTPQSVLNELLPRLVEMQIYQAILESDASEHSSRMMAMRNASDAAGDMIKELNYSFNKARQAAITQEISEIVGGAAALG